MENNWHKEYLVSIKFTHVTGNAKKFLREYLNQCTKNICLRLMLLRLATLATTEIFPLQADCIFFFLLIALHFPMYHLGNRISASLHSHQEVKHI